MKNQLTKMMFIGVCLVVVGFLAVGSVSAQNCRPNANQIAIFDDWRFEGKCKVLDIAGYATPEALGFDNDSISSILVGNNVQAEICQNDLYKGACETLTSDNDFLENTRVGNDSVSSIRVTRKGPGGRTPAAAATGVEGLRRLMIGSSWIFDDDKTVKIVWGATSWKSYKNGKYSRTTAYKLLEPNIIEYPNSEGVMRQGFLRFENNNRKLFLERPDIGETFTYTRVGK